MILCKYSEKEYLKQNPYYLSIIILFIGKTNNKILFSNKLVLTLHL